MAYNNVIPELWTPELKYQLNKNLVSVNAITNSRYVGQVNNAGDTVHVQQLSRVTINNYTKYQGTSGGITWQAPTDTTDSLVIDQQKYFAVTIDDVDAFQANVDGMRYYAQEASYQLAKAHDTRVLSHYTDVNSANKIGTTASPITLSTSNIEQYLIEAKYRIERLDAMRGLTASVIVTPEVESIILNTDGFKPATGLGDAVIRTGMIGTLFGMPILTSTNVTKVATSKGGTYTAKPSANFSATATSIGYTTGGASWQGLTSTTEYFVKIDSEYIKATGLGSTTGTLTVIARGALDTTAAAHTTGGTFTVYDVTAHAIIATPDFVTYASQINKVKMVDIQDGFEAGIKGLSIYGTKVFHSESGVDLAYLYTGI